MIRLNRPDSIITEPRDIKRRLHALETSLRARSADPARRQETAEPGPAAERRPKE